jgi:hypothetical protein
VAVGTAGVGFNRRLISGLAIYRWTSYPFPKILATSIKFTGRAKEYIGRILRVIEGKEDALIFAYLDTNGMLKNSFQTRMSEYYNMGVKLDTVRD